jgi:heterodisulfide reductase subunit B
MATLTYYPGCSLKTSSKFYDTSIRGVLSFYGIGLEELADWSCCGASAGHTVNERLAYALAARNIAIAEKEGNPFFAPCSACYNRSKIAGDKILNDKKLRDGINEIIFPLQCLGTCEIKNIIEVFHDYVGIGRISKTVSHDLSAIKVVPYYGCVLTRIPGVDVSDDAEDPTGMDTLIWAAGAKLVKWPFKMECCGAGKTLTNKDTTLKLSGRIMDMASARGADAIVTPCPLCQMNLDLLPHLGKAENNLPVLFLTEVFELAISGKIGGNGSHMIPVDGVVRKVKKKL